MSRADETYFSLLRHIETFGERRADRTGTGTIGVFGYQMRFNLADEFPLLTTKRVYWRGVVEELLWFISGSTNANDLPEAVQPWWTPWARANGELGPIYGQQYRNARWWDEVEPLLFDPPEVVRKEGLFCGVGDVGPTASLRGQSSEVLMLKNVWRNMLKRCYDENSYSYRSYGAVGVHVDPSWLNFDNFCRDARNLPGWSLKKAHPDEYTIDKDARRASNRYSKETCMWATHTEQSLNTSTGTPFTAVSPDGDQFTFPSLGEAARQHGLNLSAIHRCLKGELKTHKGWSDFTYLQPQSEGKVLRFYEVDQLKRLIAGIRLDPFGRRHLINLWNTPAMDQAELPCCHGSVIQFYVSSDMRLSCQMYQRSCDVFIGLPVNIASYALLTMMVAHVTGLELGEFIWTGGDVHVYTNHIDQVREQLSREPRPAPEVLLDLGVNNIDDFTSDNIHLVGYDPHPAIKAKVAV